MKRERMETGKVRERRGGGERENGEGTVVLFL